MMDVRNPDGKKSCAINKDTNTVEIKLKDWITTIRWLPSGKIEIVHTRKMI